MYLLHRIENSLFSSLFFHGKSLTWIINITSAGKSWLGILIRLRGSNAFGDKDSAACV